ncbi:tripartite tricarboxylate transporter substrate binding protein [uncultured Pigmentiphaga sp.]|uniref:Bug family tripartite tricarboxylate transporter substrate binding protein n=1 Tax=uncultured Pigmentiphaga sp. TaxID=340361 RepID=UPI002617D0D1|nr:tripartite tricarboxylate transporter substrate binding protein [uncultured Pigmentiphaga sp.]
MTTGGAVVAAETTYPTKPVRLVVPYPPGGSLDIIARVLGQKLGVGLGQSVVVENRAGASGAIGTQVVARSAPDGYMLLMGSPTPISILPNISPAVTYDVERDLAPVGMVATGPHVLVVGSRTPASNVKEFVAFAKAQAAPISFGTFLGSPQDLAGYIFARDTGIQLQRVSYRGSGPALNDLASGVIQFMVVELAAALPFLESGHVKAIGIASPKRSAVLPDLPTIDEQGLKGFESSGWFGVLARAGTPDPVLDRLAQEVRRAVSDPEVKEKLASVGVTATSSTREEFAAHLSAERVKWRRAVVEFGIKPSE